jgi:hypothetical protein
MECLCYGVAKIGDEVILKFTDDIDCLSPEALSGSYGLIYGNNPEEMLKELKKVVNHIGQRVPITHIELDVAKDYRILEIRR